MPSWIPRVVVPVLSVILCLFTLFEANYPMLEEVSARAIFVMLGMVICYLTFPAHKRLAEKGVFRWVDVGLAIGVIVCCGYIVVQNQPAFESFWLSGTSLGNRAGSIEVADYWIALIGVILVIEATRRSIGWAVPLLALIAILYAYSGYDAGTLEGNAFTLDHGV